MAPPIFSMPSSSMLLLFSLAFDLTNARAWEGAQKTAVYDGDDWSPRPTQFSATRRSLFKRDHVDVAVCGWIGGISASPAACASGSSCIHDTMHGYVGCCATSGPCTAGVYTSCVDENSDGSSDGSGLVDTWITTWCVKPQIAKSSTNIRVVQVVHSAIKTHIRVDIYSTIAVLQTKRRLLRRRLPANLQIYCCRSFSQG